MPKPEPTSAVRVRWLHVIDVTPEKLTFTHFMWRPPQAVAEIDTMKPALVYEVPRKA